MHARRVTSRWSLAAAMCALFAAGCGYRASMRQILSFPPGKPKDMAPIHVWITATGESGMAFEELSKKKILVTLASYDTLRNKYTEKTKFRYAVEAKEIAWDTRWGEPGTVYLNVYEIVFRSVPGRGMLPQPKLLLSRSFTHDPAEDEFTDGPGKTWPIITE